MKAVARTASGVAAALALGFVLAGGTPLQAQERELRLLTFEGYADDAWVREFEAAYGAEVVVTYIESVDGLFTGMTASQGADYDLVSIDTSLLGSFIGQDLIVPFDMALIPNSANLLPAFQDVAELRQDGEIYGVPITWGSLGLIYDAGEVAPPPSSWEVLWDESFKGRIVALDDADNNIATAAIILGYGDPFDLDDEEMEGVKRKLIDQKEVLLGYVAGFEEGNDVWESGDAVLMFSMGEFQAIDLARRGHNVAYTIPQEGGIGWLDSWALSKGVRDLELAHAWVDFFLDRSVGERLALTYGYGSTTVEIDGRDYADRLTWLRPAEDLGRRVELWEEVKAAPVP